MCLAMSQLEAPTGAVPLVNADLYAKFITEVNTLCRWKRWSWEVILLWMLRIVSFPLSRTFLSLRRCVEWTPNGGNYCAVVLSLCLLPYFANLIDYHYFVCSRNMRATKIRQFIARSEHSFLTNMRAQAFSDSIRFGTSADLTLGYIDVLHEDWNATRHTGSALSRRIGQPKLPLMLFLSGCKLWVHRR